MCGRIWIFYFGELEFFRIIRSYVRFEGSKKRIVNFGFEIGVVVLVFLGVFFGLFFNFTSILRVDLLFFCKKLKYIRRF